MASLQIVVRILPALLLLVTIYLFSAIPIRTADNYFHLIFCDIGQGDGMLLTFQHTQILIDSGPDDKILNCLSKHLPFGDKNIEFVVATHPDMDHIGGFKAVFRQYTASNIFLLGIGKTTRGFLDFRTSILDEVARGATLHLGKRGDSISVKDVFLLKFISPDREIGSSLLFSKNISETQLWDILNQEQATKISINDLSIASFLLVGKYRILLMADVEKPTEQALLSQGLIPQVDILKAGHHGSKTSSSQEFLEKAKPEYVVISAGKKNRYGHPHQETLERISALSSKMLRTDQQGDIEFITDGTFVKWKTER